MEADLRPKGSKSPNEGRRPSHKKRPWRPATGRRTAASGHAKNKTKKPQPGGLIWLRINSIKAS